MRRHSAMNGISSALPLLETKLNQHTDVLFELVHYKQLGLSKIKNGQGRACVFSSVFFGCSKKSHSAQPKHTQ